MSENLPRDTKAGPEELEKKWEPRDDTGKSLDWFCEVHDVKGPRIFISRKMQAGG